MVRVPPGFDATEPWDLLVFLHGWNGCTRELMGAGPTRCIETPGEGGAAPPRPGWNLAGSFDEAGLHGLMLMPQLSFRQRDGGAGRFTEGGFARRFVESVAAQVESWPSAPPRRVILAAHSAGFESALAWIDHGDVPVDEVILFDALYARTEAFARWVQAEPGRRLVSIYTGGGSTARQSRRLRRLTQRAALSVGGAASSPAPVVVFRTNAPHRDVPQAHFAEVLRGVRQMETHDEREDGRSAELGREPD